jgi:hypothetical protein
MSTGRLIAYLQKGGSMDNIGSPTPQSYIKPEIVDHGSLSELTAALGTGTKLDAAFPAGTPKTLLTFSGP